MFDSKCSVCDKPLGEQWQTLNQTYHVCNNCFFTEAVNHVKVDYTPMGLAVGVSPDYGKVVFALMEKVKFRLNCQVSDKDLNAYYSACNELNRQVKLD